MVASCDDYFEGRATYQEYLDALAIRRAAYRKRVEERLRFWEAVGLNVQTVLSFVTGCIGIATAVIALR